MKPTGSVEALQKESRDEKAKGNFARSIACIHEIISQLGDNTVDLKIAAQEWQRMAGMYIRLEMPREAEVAARNALGAYLRNRALRQGEWHRERDQNIAEYSMTLARSLVDQERYEEALPYAEESEAIFRLKGDGTPIVKELIIPRMNWLRAKVAEIREKRQMGQD